jgi:hypothetical protein
VPLIAPRIVVPDSSHWAVSIDDALSGDRVRQAAARGSHRRLLDQGKIPFLSWHHVEELLGIESEASARARIDFLQSLPLMAWMQLPKWPGRLGGTTDILAAEAIRRGRGL